MKKAGIIFAFSAALLNSYGQSADTAKLYLNKITKGIDYALLIHNSRFDRPESFPDYERSWHDVDSLAKSLALGFNFKVEVLANPTRSEILKKLTQYQSKRFRPEDQLLIFYSGRHYPEDDFKGASLVLTDSSPEDTSTMINHKIFRAEADKVPCNKIFVVLNSKFKLWGEFALGTEASIQSDEHPTDYELAKEFTSVPRTRRYLEQSSFQESSDSPYFSVVGQAFLESLKQTIFDGNSVITAREMEDFLPDRYPAVELSFFGKGRGNFIFYPASSLTRKPSPDELFKTLTDQSYEARKAKNYPEVIRLSEEARKLAEREFGKKDKKYYSTVSIIADAYYDLDDYEVAAKYYLEALSLSNKNDRHYSMILKDLGYTYRDLGNRAKAESYLVQHVKAEENLRKDEVMYAYATLASFYSNDREKYRMAEKLYLDALKLSEAKEGRVNNWAFADWSNNLALLYEKMEQPSRQIALFQQALMIYGAGNKDNASYTRTLNNLGSAYLAQGNLAMADSSFQQVLKIKGQRGKETKQYADALFNLAAFYIDRQMYKRAEPLCLEAISCYRKLGLTTGQSYALVLNNTGVLYHNMDQPAQAEPYYVEALALNEKLSGKTSDDYALSLGNLAGLYTNLGNYQKAEVLYLDHLRITENRVGKQHPDYAFSLGDLALLYNNIGDYPKAEAFYREAGNILKNAPEIDLTEYSRCLQGQGLLYTNMGNFNRAEQLLLESLAITEKKSGKGIDYSTTLNYLGILNSKLGNYGKATTMFDESVEILRKSQKESVTSAYGAFLGNQGTNYYDLGNYDRAEQLFLESLKVFEELGDHKSSFYLNSTNNLGKTYIMRGKFLDAESTLKLALNASKVDNTLIAEYASALNNLALLYSRMNDKRAEDYFLETLKVREQLQGKTHPEYTECLSDLAIFYSNAGTLDKAETFFLAANQNLLLQIKSYFPGLSEKEKASFYSEKISTHLEVFNSYIVQRRNSSRQLTGTLYNNQLATKALLFSASNKIKERISGSDDQELKTLYAQWQQKKNYLAKVYQMNLVEVRNAKLDVRALEENINSLDKQLSIKSELFADNHDRRTYTWQDIQKKLKPHEAAVELVRFRKHRGQFTDTVYYAALVITTLSKVPELVLFENGKNLESKIVRYYRNMIINKWVDTVSYNQFWRPVREELKKTKGISKVYLAPDGVFNLINLNTLRDPATGKFVSDEFDIQWVTNTKDILRPKRKSITASEASLFGFPDYNNSGVSPNNGDKRDHEFDYAKFDTLKRYFESGKITSLPGTKAEIDAVSKLLVSNRIPSMTYMEAAATEEEIKTLNSPRILHIATHGFFMEVPKNRKSTYAGFNNNKIIENPLLRSGLLLAGSQKVVDGHPSSGVEDGILTAFEAMNLSLDKTDLVVLSACETGLGEVKNGEGVYGLQRAFQTAGTQSILMSLWKVDDLATQQLMTLFYELWLKTGDKRSAFKQAQNAVRVKYPEPYYWGAFVIIGD